MLTTKLPCSSPILLGWFESFAPQNLQAFSKNEVTNVNVNTKHKSNFSVRICLNFEFKVVSVFRSSRKHLQYSISAAFKPVHVCTFYTDILIKYFDLLD